VQALLLLRQIALVLPAPACQNVLRGAYRSYVSSAKFVSPSSLPTLSFMAAGFVELSSLDLSVTYQVCVCVGGGRRERGEERGGGDRGGVCVEGGHLL
jgi:hypothetical protein